MRSLPFAFLTGLLIAITPAEAQEPLLLHIRPNNAPLPDGAGSGDTLSDAQSAARALARREAVWQRAERRARLAIASVCTGCLSPEPLRPTPPTAVPVRTADASLPDPSPQDASPPDSSPRTEGDP